MMLFTLIKTIVEISILCSMVGMGTGLAVIGIGAILSKINKEEYSFYKWCSKGVECLFSSTLIFCLTMFCAMGVLAYGETHFVELENYSINMEVMDKDYDVFYNRNEEITKYVLAVECENDALALEVSGSDWAKYSRGEVIEVEYTIKEDLMGNTIVEHEIVGLAK